MLNSKYLIIFFVSLIVLLFFFNRGFAYYDEGFILHAAQRVARGEIVYKDFDFIYTPGAIFLLAAVFKLFGESILIGRILILVVGTLTATFIYYICFKLSKNKLISFLALLIYLSWGPSHINFPWPTIFAFSFGLLATYLTGINPVFSGVFVVVTMLLKQNFGIGVLLSSLLSLMLINKQRKFQKIILFGTGLSAASLVFIFYLFLTDSLKNFLDNILFTNIRVILIDKALSTGFPSGLKSLIYLCPGIISLLAVFVAFKQQSKNIIYPLFTLFFYLFGIRPTTDYPHLTILLASTGIPLTVIYLFSTRILDALQKASLTRMTFALSEVERSFWLAQNLVKALFLIIIFFGIYTSLWKNYYKWDSPLIKQNYYISHSRVRIFVDQKFKTVIPEITDFVEQKTKKGDYSFVFYNASMFNFLTDRQNPTRYINFSPDLSLGEKREREVINNLKEMKVKLIVTHEPPERWGNPLITDFILKKYQKKKDFFEFSLWVRD